MLLPLTKEDQEEFHQEDHPFGATMRNTLRITSEAFAYGADWLMSQISV